MSPFLSRLSVTAGALLLLLALGAPRALAAQGGEPIKDNSFLIEEAYNQERGVVQHIATHLRDARSSGWASSFTDEWPLGGVRHQLSATLLLLHAPEGEVGIGDAALNYRYQLRGAEHGPLFVAPRATLILPTGDAGKGFGAGGPGVQVNLPVSVEHGARLATHWNVGATYTPRARALAGGRAGTTSFALGQSVVWLAHPRLNALVETLWTRTELATGAGATERSDALVVVPGLRGAFNFPSGLQIVPGLGAPIGLGPSRGEHALFLYLSVEHDF